MANSTISSAQQAALDRWTYNRQYYKGPIGALRVAGEYIRDKAAPYVPAVRRAISDYVVPSIGAAAAYTAAGYIPYRYRFLRRVAYGVASRYAYRSYRQPWIQRSSRRPWTRRTYFQRRTRRGFRRFRRFSRRRNTRGYVERFLGGSLPNV